MSEQGEINRIKVKYAWHNKLKKCPCFMCRLIRHQEAELAEKDTAIKSAYSSFSKLTEAIKNYEGCDDYYEPCNCFENYINEVIKEIEEQGK